MIIGASTQAGQLSLDAKYFTGKDNNSVDVSLNKDNDSQVHAKYGKHQLQNLQTWLVML